MKFMLLLFFFAAVYFAYKYYHPDFREIFGKSASTERIDDTVSDTLELEGAACIVADEPIEATEAEIVTEQEKEAVKVTAEETTTTKKSSDNGAPTTTAKSQKQEKVASSESSKEAAVIAPADNENHLTFKGVPINGTLSQFVAKMGTAGFKRINKSIDDAGKGQVKLVGDFAGYNNCCVFVSTQSQLDLVCKIRVEFPEREHWEELYGDYKKLKGLLTEKYGSPKNVVEKTYPSYRDDPSDLMYGIKFDINTYKTTFAPSNGTIVIYLTHDGTNDPYVCLEYFDAENMNAEKNLALSDL